MESCYSLSFALSLGINTVFQPATTSTIAEPTTFIAYSGTIVAVLATGTMTRLYWFFKWRWKSQTIHSELKANVLNGSVLDVTICI